MTTTEIVKAQGTDVQREGFAGKEIERRNETSTSSMVAQARAEIEARYVMALQRPRDDDNVRVRLLKECRRSVFAERAFYSIPRGDKPGRMTGAPGRIEGLSIRFAEACVRLSGNIVTATRVTYDDDYKRQVTVIVTDLETNAIYTADAVVEKTVERHKPKPGAVILGKRTNSANVEVFIVQTTDDELLQKQANIVARMSRTLELKLVPADTLDECEKEIVKTVRDRVIKDPDAERKALADAFASLNVLPADLKLYLGHDLGVCSPAELLDLRGLFSAIREGDVTWADALAERTTPKVDADGVVVEAKTTGGAVAEKIKARVAKQAEKVAAKSAPQESRGAAGSDTTKGKGSEGQPAAPAGTSPAAPAPSTVPTKEPPPMTEEEKKAALKAESDAEAKRKAEEERLEELRRAKSGKRSREPGEG